MNQFVNNTINLYGDKGKEWLSELPNIVQKIAKAWLLTNLQAVENLSYNYVLSGFRSEQPIILKIGLDIEGLKREASALKAFDGYGVVNVLDAMDGALLLEKIEPGTSLMKYFPQHDLEAVQIVCDIMRRLYQAPLPPENQFPTIHHWLTALNRGENVPPAYQIKARTLSDQLLKTTGELKLLHGDLHHYNILASKKTFVVIDPKGVIGEEAYEVASFIRNPIPDLLNVPNCSDLIMARILEFAHRLKINPERIKAWCFVQAVLSWIWALEDGDDPTYFINLTKVFDTFDSLACH